MIRAASRHADRIAWAIGVVGPLVLWHYAAKLAENPLVPGPFEVLAAFVPLIRSGELATAILESSYVLLFGFLAGLIPGLALGMLIGRFRALYVCLDAYISALYSVPTIAMAPILIIAIGWGPEAKIVLVAILVFLPICINALVGVREAPRDLRELAKSFCSSEFQTWRDVYLPAAMPAIIPGVRIAVGRALTGLIVAEFSTAITGLGNLILVHSENFQVAESLVPVAVLVLFGFAAYRALDAAERWASRGMARD